VGRSSGVGAADRSAVDADATTVGVNDGTAAGQEVPHAHVHIVPRFEDDGGGPIHAAAGTVRTSPTTNSTTSRPQSTTSSRSDAVATGEPDRRRSR
jgi:Diadenosine tetraphosphate (Ap4A) hydrolase and other HIT family hydrolases